jgi:hypothetical protein
MRIWAVLFVCILLTACQAGKIPCPEVKFAKLKHSKAQKGSRFVSSPSKMMASTKGSENKTDGKNNVNLERLRANRVTGKQMLEQYGTVDEWDCPSPAGKKKYSKVTKENIRKNEKKIREHMKQRNASDSVAVTPPLDLR